MKYLAITCISLTATGVLSADSRATVTALFSVTGECQMLVYAEEERPCGNTLLHSEYESGRIGFYFIDDSEGGGAVSFSGMGQEQRSPSENLRLQPIDGIVLNGEGQSALGTCSFENPFIGPSRIQCSAFVESGELFSGFFISDGSRPHVISPEDYRE